MGAKEAEFKRRFTEMMAGLRPTPSPEDVYWIGALAARLIDHVHAPSWKQFKATLSSADYTALLASFEKQGKEFTKQGALPQRHAMEVLAWSLVAKTQTHDIQVLGDDGVLNGIVDDAINIHRAIQTDEPAKSD